MKYEYFANPKREIREKHTRRLTRVSRPPLMAALLYQLAAFSEKD